MRPSVALRPTACDTAVVKPIPTKLIALIALAAVGSSSSAAGELPAATPCPVAAVAPAASAPAVLPRATPLAAAELDEYRRLTAASRDLASVRPAGASDTTKVVVVIVAVVAVAAVVVYSNSAASGFSLN